MDCARDGLIRLEHNAEAVAAEQHALGEGPDILPWLARDVSDRGLAVGAAAGKLCAGPAQRSGRQIADAQQEHPDNAVGDADRRVGDLTRLP
jgi:hypothetical protein